MLVEPSAPLPPPPPPPPQPIPVIKKKIHDTTIVKDDPTDIHKVKLAPLPEPKIAPPPVRAIITPKPEVSSFNWLWLLPLLCCLPLLCLPCILCCRKKTPLVPGSYSKPTRSLNPTAKVLEPEQMTKLKMVKMEEQIIEVPK